MISLTLFCLTGVAGFIRAVLIHGVDVSVDMPFLRFQIVGDRTECTKLIEEYPDGFFEVESATGITDAFAHYSLRAQAYQQAGEPVTINHGWV